MEVGRRYVLNKRVDVGLEIVEDDNGNFVLSGRTYTEGTGGWQSDPLLIKVDHKGNLIWAKAYNLGKDCDGGNQIVTTNDGGYVIVGWTYSQGFGDVDILVYKVDEDGNLIWAKVYGDKGIDEAVYITKLDEGYAIMASTNSFRDGFDILYFMINNYGNIMWSKVFREIKTKNMSLDQE